MFASSPRPQQSVKNLRRTFLGAVVLASSFAVSTKAEASTFSPLVETMMDWSAFDMFALSFFSGLDDIPVIPYDYTLDLAENTFNFDSKSGALFAGLPFSHSASGVYDPVAKTVTVSSSSSYNPDTIGTGTYTFNDGANQESGTANFTSAAIDNFGNEITYSGKFTYKTVLSAGGLRTLSDHQGTLSGTLSGSGTTSSWNTSGRDFIGPDGKFRLVTNVPANPYTSNPITFILTESSLNPSLSEFTQSGTFESSLTPVPLPQSFLLLLGAIGLGVGGMSRKKKSKPRFGAAQSSGQARLH